MKKVAAFGPTLSGIDVYHGDDVVSFNGNDFVFLKATEGTGYVDSTFAFRWAKLKANGIPRGAYHFFRASGDPTAQAEHFRSVVGALDPNDMPPVLDLEDADHIALPVCKAKAEEFLRVIESIYRRIPIIYGPSFFLESLGLTSTRYPLWVADYGSNPPRVPEPWKNWTFWQYSENGVDKNHFNGDRQAFADVVARSNILLPPEPAPPAA